MEKIIFIIIIIFSSSCNSSKVYTAREKENIRITDSIANSHIQSRIIEFQENYD
jgi:hypothetical protein